MTLMPVNSPKGGKNPFSQEGAASGGLLRTMQTVRCAGYGLLLLSLLDWAVIILPPQFMNPAWEFQTIGALVERVPVPLIGLVLVLFGEFQQRSRWEMPVVKGLSWLSFGLGILFLIMVPLGIIDTGRLNEQSSNQLSAAYQQQLGQVQQIEERLNQVDEGEINQFLQKRGLDQGELTPDDVREQALAELNTAKGRGQIQLDAAKDQRWRVLLENSIKWNLGAAISSACFLYIWRVSRWARSSRRRLR